MFTYSNKELDALKEFAGMGIGKAANALNSMLASHVELKPSNLTIYSEDQINKDIENQENINYSIVEMDYSGNISGTTCMLITRDNSLKMVRLLVGDLSSDDEDEMDAIRMGTLSEIGNIVLNSFLGMISNILQMNLSYTIPRYIESTIATMYKEILQDNGEEKAIIKIDSNFIVEDLSIKGSIIIILSVDPFFKLNELIKKYLEELS
ncbi:MAG: hypothetical protein L3J12_04855 [Spirochaetales bacterium]|nr:hypothetical protein [Spirochaetales bacterium]